MQESRKIEFIQCLRGIAALMVVLYHGSRFISPYGTGLGDMLFGPGAAMGVALFFVLSGFIMVYTTADKSSSTTSFLDFSVKRLARIWPAYIIAACAYIFIGHGWNEYLSEPGNTRLFIESLFFLPVSAKMPPLPVGWTLNYEMYFYLFFGAAMLFGRARWLAFAGWVGLTLVAIPLALGFFTLSTYPDAPFDSAYARLMFAPIIWTFVAGVVIAFVYRSRATLPEWAALPTVLLAAALMVWQYMTRFRYGTGVTECGGSAALLVIALALYSKNHEIRCQRLLVSLGNVSFSLYLWHPLVQETLYIPMQKIGAGAMTNGFPQLFITTVGSITVAAVSYHFIEIKLSNLIKRVVMARFSRRAAGLAADRA